MGTTSFDKLQLLLSFSALLLMLFLLAKLIITFIVIRETKTKHIRSTPLFLFHLPRSTLRLPSPFSFPTLSHSEVFLKFLTSLKLKRRASAPFHFLRSLMPFIPSPTPFSLVLSPFPLTYPLSSLSPVFPSHLPFFFKPSSPPLPFFPHPPLPSV